MLPADGPTGALTAVRRNGATVATEKRTLAGTDYVVFDAADGSYTATYGTPPVTPEPETTITAFSVTGDTASASFASDTAGATFQCRLDSGAFVGCASPRQFTGLAAGQHTIEVRATAGGKTDSTPAARGFTIASATPGGNSEPPVGGGESGGPGTQPGRRRARRAGRPLASAHGRPDESRPQLEHRHRHAARDVPGDGAALPRPPPAPPRASATSGRARSP